VRSEHVARVERGSACPQARHLECLSLSSVARMLSGVVEVDSSCGVACTVGTCALFLHAAPVHYLPVCQVTLTLRWVLRYMRPPISHCLQGGGHNLGTRRPSPHTAAAHPDASAARLSASPREQAGPRRAAALLGPGALAARRGAGRQRRAGERVEHHAGRGRGQQRPAHAAAVGAVGAGGRRAPAQPSAAFEYRL